MQTAHGKQNNGSKQTTHPARLIQTLAIRSTWAKAAAVRDSMPERNAWVVPAAPHTYLVNAYAN